MIVPIPEKPMYKRLLPIAQLDLFAKGAEQPPPRLPADHLSQLGQLLQKLLLEVLDAERAAREDADE